MITRRTTLTELAAILSIALERQGIIATLSGGVAVSIYSENRYVSQDLDFVTTARIPELKAAREPLGFQHARSTRLSVFDHPQTAWYLEFSPAPISFGGTYIDPSHRAIFETGVGKLRIISPTTLFHRRSVVASFGVARFGVIHIAPGRSAPSLGSGALRAS